MNIAVWITILLCVISLVYTMWFWRYERKRDSRNFDDYIRDIRAMNTYNSYFLAGILIFFGLIIDAESSKIHNTSLYLLLLAFLCSSLALFFIPLRKPAKNKKGKAKFKWLFTLIFSQFTAILTTVGIVYAVIIKFNLL